MKWLNNVSDRKLFGIMIIGAYVLSLGTLAHIPIPSENSEYFGQLMIGLVGAVGVIVGAIWKTTASEDKSKESEHEALKVLAEKVPPPTGEAKAAADETIVEPDELPIEDRINREEV